MDNGNEKSSFNFSPPSPHQFFCKKEQASSDLSAGSLPGELILSRGQERTGECYGLLRGCQVLHPDSMTLSTAQILPTHSGLCPGINFIARDALNYWAEGGSPDSEDGVSIVTPCSKTTPPGLSPYIHFLEIKTLVRIRSRSLRLRSGHRV